MNKIVNKFLLAGDKFMPELHWKHLGFIYSTRGPYIKHRKRIQKFKETDYLNYIFKNKLDRASFAHDTGLSDSKDLAKRTIPNKISKDRTHEIAQNPQYDGYQKDSLFHKKAGSRARTNVKEVLARELHKTMIKKFKRRKLYVKFRFSWNGIIIF